MPEAELEAPKKRRGRPPGKKRHDPVAAPVDGNYEKDVVLNKEPGKRYAWLTTKGIDSDASRFRHRGYVKTEPREGGPKPAWDNDEGIDGSFTVGGLTLFEANEDRAVAMDDRDRARSERRMQGIHETAVATGGYMTRTVEK